MWTKRDQFSNKQLTFIDYHLNIRLYKQRLSNQPHMQQGVFKVHLAANSLRSNRVSSQSQLCTSSYHVKVLQSSVRLGRLHTNPPPVRHRWCRRWRWIIGYYTLLSLPYIPDVISASAYQLSQRHTPPPFALPTENITCRASIAYHCATLSFPHYYGGNSHISGTSSSWLTKILAYQTSSCASCRLYNTWTITFPCTIKFKEGLETTDKWPKS